MMFDRVLKTIEENKIREFNTIPWGFPRFEEILPGITQKTFYLVTANSGIGKSQLTNHMFLYAPYNFVRNNPHTDIKVKIFYYSMEVDAASIIVQGMAKRIFETTGIITEPNKILSLGKNKISQEIYDLVLTTRKYFEELEDILYIYEDSVNPYGIYKRVYEYCESHGVIHKKKITKKVKQEDGNILEIDEEIFDYYVPNNPREFVIIIADHISLLNKQNGMDLKGTMDHYAKDMRTLRNLFGVIPVSIQQQMAASESQEYYKGQSIESKLEPSLYGLGESKTIQREVNVALGIFAPNRYNIKTYRGYDITKFNDHFRSLSILKNRNGMSDAKVGLYFNGAVNHFEELPRAEEFMKNPKLYEKKQ